MVLKNVRTNASRARGYSRSILIAVTLATAALLAACDNQLVGMVAEVRAEALSPVIAITVANSSVEPGSSLDFNQISVGSYSDIDFKISNSGKSALRIDCENIAVNLDTGTEDGSFTIVKYPSREIGIDANSILTIRFNPASSGTKKATLEIPTNDHAQPDFSVNVLGSGWAVILSTNAVSGITTTTATGGGTITDDGGISIESRGICWSTSPNPTTEDSKKENAGVGIGVFNDLMTGLAAGNLYYVRAYASNGISTGYGTQVSFTTVPAAPATPSVSSIGYPAGSGKLNVSWPEVHGATVYDVFVNTENAMPDSPIESNIASASCTLTGLIDYQDYYVWIKAKNATGTSSPSTTMVQPVFPGVKVTGLLLVSKVALEPGTGKQVTATIVPENATKATVTWESSRPSIASINGAGSLTAASVGNSTITATLVDDGSTFSAASLVAVTGITTIAGDGTEGTATANSGGIGTSISIGRPNAIATDKDGNVYFSDSGNHCVRKISPDGQMITIAGNGTLGDDSTQASGSSALVALPDVYGILVDSGFNVYISTTGRIRKIAPSGSFITFAGNGNVYAPLPAPFTDGGLAANTSLGGPTNIVLDAPGNAYFVDGIRYRVRKIGLAGYLSTICGTGDASFSGDGGSATLATIHNSGGIAIDASGNIYLADAGNGRIRKINTSGIISTIAGIGNYAGDWPWSYNGDGRQATTAQLNNPQSVIVDDQGNVYFADTMHSSIRKVDASGIISTVAGSDVEGFSGDGGPATSAQLKIPSGVAIDALGNLYIADSNNFRVRKVVR